MQEKKHNFTSEDQEKIKTFLERQSDFDFLDYDDFLKYCFQRGVRNPAFKIIDRRIFNEATLNKLFNEYMNPIKRISKRLDMNYDQLAEATGYTKNGIQNAITKGNISQQLLRALELLESNITLNKKLTELQTKMDSLEQELKKFFKK